MMKVGISSTKYPPVVSSFALLFLTIIAIISADYASFGGYRRHYLSSSLAFVGATSRNSDTPGNTNSNGVDVKMTDTNSAEETSSLSSEVPLLPQGDPNDTTIPSLKFGETMRFEEMGPVIINSDGTTRRIANWDAMTKHEQEVTWRRISKRNEERRKLLMQQYQEQQEQHEQNSDDQQPTSVTNSEKDEL